MVHFTGLRQRARQFIAGILLAAACAAPAAHADAIPAGWTASNMEPVGYTGLDGHMAPFKLSIKKAGDRWYLYTAHSGKGGLSIVDVTDPAQPRPVKFIPGPAGTADPQVSLHGNLLVWGMSKPFSLEQTAGGVARQRYIEPKAPADRSYEEGAQFWDISNPVDPKYLSKWGAAPSAPIATATPAASTPS
jgi:hypothetical protein